MCRGTLISASAVPHRGASLASHNTNQKERGWYLRERERGHSGEKGGGGREKRGMRERETSTERIEFVKTENTAV